MRLATREILEYTMQGCIDCMCACVVKEVLRKPAAQHTAGCWTRVLLAHMGRLKLARGFGGEMDCFFVID